MRRSRHFRSKPALAFFCAALCSLKCVAAEPPAGTVLAAVRTPSGNYLTVVDGGGLGGPDTGPAVVALHSDAAAAGPWETFTVVWLNPTYTRFALRTSRGGYVTAVNGGGIGGPNDGSAPVHTDATASAQWERLTFNFLPNNQVTIRAPNGRYLTAVNGGGVAGTGAALIRTDAEQQTPWGVFTLVREAAISRNTLVPGPRDAADDGVKLTQAERALITRQLGKSLPYHVSISRSAEFPEVLRLMHYIDDAGFEPFATIVDATWIERDDVGNLWMPREATRRILQNRGWPTLDESPRKALALRWVEDSLPPGWGSQTTADGGHAPEVAIENGNVVVRLWLIRRSTSIAGPRFSRDSAATVYRFKPDGSTAEDDPTRRAAPPVR